MAIAWSQIDGDSKVLARDVLYSFIHSKWIYALPMPAFFALSGTLVYQWFSGFDETAAIAANFVVSSAVLIPLAAVTTDFGQAPTPGRGLDAWQYCYCLWARWPRPPRGGSHIKWP